MFQANEHREPEGRREDAPAKQPANPRSASEVRSEPRTIWVLGSTGYVGRAVTQEVVRQYPDARVIALGHHRVDPWVMENTHFIMSDLGSFDFNWLERYPPDVVFHCGRMAGGNWLTRERAGRNGARANQRWIQALSTLPVKPVVVYCSGTLMYGNQADPVTERVPHQPVAYARFYQKAEAPWYGAEALDVRWGLPAWITGPDSWFAAFFTAPALRTGRVPYYGSGAQWMSLVHLRDCARQLVGVYADGSPGCSYNIYGGEAISQRDFAQKIADRLKLPVAAVSLEDTRKKYGTTVLEALTSNIPVNTVHMEWKKTQELEFRSADAILDDAMDAYLRLQSKK